MRARARRQATAPAPADWRDCPTPQKRKFLDREQAFRHLDRMGKIATGEIRAGGRRLVFDDVALRAYECRCGYWHATSKGAGLTPSGRVGKMLPPGSTEHREKT